MITFRLRAHTGRDVQVIEILDGDTLLGVIYPEAWGIRLVSKYFNSDDQVSFDSSFPPVLGVRLP
jgi:hypothetical protein